MNFLAHSALAHDAGDLWGCDERMREGLLAGAVIGDFVKGRVPEAWPEPLQAGVRLHRKVDALSNRSLHVSQSNSLYMGELRRFAPIFTDLLGDYFLSCDWPSFHSHPLRPFSQTCYAAIDTHSAYLSGNGNRFFEYMQEVDLLANYDRWEHVQRGIHSVLRRLRRMDLVPAVEAASEQILEPAQTCFHAYYPELRNALNQWRAY